MKKYVLLFLMLFCINIMTIKADDIYECRYYDSTGMNNRFSGDTHSFNIKINVTKKEIFSDWAGNTSDGDWEYAEINGILDTVIDSSWNEEYIVNKLTDNGKKAKDKPCPQALTVVKTSGAYYALFNDGYLPDIIGKTFYQHEVEAYTGWDKLYTTKELCEAEHSNCGERKYEEQRLFQFDDNYADNGNPTVGLSTACPSYETKLDELKKLKKLYDSCIKSPGNCKNSSGVKSTLSKVAKDYNEQEDLVRGLCKSVLQNQNYGQACMTRCLDMTSDLSKISIDNIETKIKCSLTEDVLSIVYNVLKWAKYIAPVIAIILSILDFIKAIASQNEDDMKKAQGKFIKRLIVAALLFLVPLIINFMLGTFGLYNSSCDIAEIFSS